MDFEKGVLLEHEMQSLLVEIGYYLYDSDGVCREKIVLCARNEGFIPYVLKNENEKHNDKLIFIDSDI